MLKLAVLISNTGSGTNLQAIIDAIENHALKAIIILVISGSKNAYGIVRAKKHNIPVICLEKNDNLEDLLLNKYKINYIILAGWKSVISSSLITKFPNKILNLHPGLIPDTIEGVVKNPDGTNGLWNRGKLSNNAVINFINSKATYAGSSIHILSNEFDFGPVISRCFEKISKEDTAESLYARLKIKENEMYVKTLIKLSATNK